MDVLARLATRAVAKRGLWGDSEMLAGAANSRAAEKANATLGPVGIEALGWLFDWPASGF